MNTPTERKPDLYYNSPRENMHKFIPSTCKRTLEIGCGEGLFSEWIKRTFNTENWAVEYVKEKAKIASTKLDKVFSGDVALFIDELPNHYFDTIIFNDVLEHLTDPYNILIRLKQKLTPNGVIVCSIPNVRYFRTFIAYVFKRDWKYEDHGILDRTHLRFFTKKSIYNTFNDLGYEIKTFEGLCKTKSLRAHLLNILFLGSLSDTFHLQYAVVARLNDHDTTPCP